MRLKFIEYNSGNIMVINTEKQKIPAAFNLESAIEKLNENKEDMLKVIEENSICGIFHTRTNDLKGLFEEYTREQIEILKSVANATDRKTEAGEMAEIKKCPFCGGKAELKEIKGFDRQVVSAYVFCQDCEASTKNYATANVAIEAWNRRCCG